MLSALPAGGAAAAFYDSGKNLYCPDPAVHKLYDAMQAAGSLSGEKFSVTSGTLLEGGFRFVVFVSIGAMDKLTSYLVRRASYLAAKECISHKTKSLALCLPDEFGPLFQQMAAEGALLAGYRFDCYKMDKKAQELSLSLVKGNGFDEEAVRLGVLTARQKCFAKDLVNTPANDMTPQKLAEEIQRDGGESGYTVEVLNAEQIQELGMEAFYAVGKGSDNPPVLIVMRYEGHSGSSKTLGLIGKGVTYDSGGYNLKSGPGMVKMKSDMGGAAAVAAAMGILARSGARVNVVGIIAACENLISGHAFKNGDIIGSMAGKHIEIHSTDAEGRLTLVDALTYAIRNQHVTAAVDVATLTGAAVSTFGTEIIPVLSNDDSIWRMVDASAWAEGEKVWRLPMDENLGKLIRCENADLKNRGGNQAGTITAGMFIAEFSEDRPWAHLDIAGSAYADSDKYFCGSSATGSPVGLLRELAVRYFES